MVGRRKGDECEMAGSVHVLLRLDDTVCGARTGFVQDGRWPLIGRRTNAYRLGKREDMVELKGHYLCHPIGPVSRWRSTPAIDFDGRRQGDASNVLGTQWNSLGFIRGVNLSANYTYSQVLATPLTRLLASHTVSFLLVSGNDER